MILWESINHHYQPTCPWHVWREAADTIADEVERPAKHGGSLNVGWFHWWKARHVYGRHLFAIVCAARAHLSGAGSEQIPHAYYRFGARYAGLLYDPAVNRAPSVAQKIVVTPDRVWWRKYVYERRLADGARQVIVHLVNPPVQAKTQIDTLEEPAVVQPVLVTCRMGAPKHAWWLSPDEVDPSRTLKPKPAGGGVTIQVPRLAYWGILVMQY